MELIVVGLLGLVCLFVFVVLVAGVAFFVWRSRRPQGTAFPSLLLQLDLPPHWHAAEVAGQIEVTLPSAYTFRIVRGDGRRVLQERAAWLQDTPYRSQKRVRRHDNSVFAYTAREDELDDVSFVACQDVGGVTWYAETNGAIVEHREPQLSPEDAAEQARLQDEMAAALQRGEAPDGPVFMALTEQIGAIAARSVSDPTPSRVTTMTEADCDAAIKMIASMRSL